MNEVEERPVEWVKEGWLARRMITMLDGDPGINKSSYTYDIAAQISRSGGVAVLLQAEDDIAAVAKPRLKAAGADLSRVVVLQGKWDKQGESLGLTIPDDIELIRSAIQQAKAKWNPNLVFLAVDPVVAYLDAKATNSWKDQDVRRALGPLQKLCVSEDAACMVVRHFKKDTESSLLHRGGGSIGFQGLVRSACAIVLDPDDEETDPNKRRRLLVSVKSNLGKKPRTRAFRVQPYRYDAALSDGSLETIETFKLVWDGESDHTAETLAEQGSKSGSKGEATKQHRCEDFLRGILARGPVEQTEVMAKAMHAVGASERTIRRASETLTVAKEKFGAARGGSQRWYWALNYADFAAIDDGLVMSKPGVTPLDDGHLKDQATTIDMTRPGSYWIDLMARATNDDVALEKIVDETELHAEIDRYMRSSYEHAASQELREHDA